jgi:hypothetical protein
VPKTDEWNLLKHQFDALVHGESVGADNIEKIFDAEFHRRFAELINRVAGVKTERWAAPAIRAISGRLER